MLNIFENDSVITAEELYEKNMISSKKASVKILGDGELEKKLIDVYKRQE